MNTREAVVMAPRRGFVSTGLGALLGLLTSRRDTNPSASRLPKRVPHLGHRVITGVDPQGRSCVASESPVPPNAAWKTDTMEGLDFWVAREVPTPLAAAIEPTEDWKPANRAPAGGVIGRLIMWMPGTSYPRHTTPTLDFIIVVSGQLELVLDTESRILRAGDVVIQRGTAHAWRVVGTEPCTFAAILIDAKSPA